jgi:DNA-binding CsgD family transcriptional regulator
LPSAEIAPGMINLAVISIFLISVAVAATSLVITTQLRKKYKLDFISSLLYQQSFYFMFGFYALWGQAVIIPFLAELADNRLIELITGITLLLGFPFLVFAWLMYIELCRELSGRRRSNAFIGWFLIIHISLLVLFGLVLVKHPEIKAFASLKLIYMLCTAMYALIGIFLLSTKGKNKPPIKLHDRQYISLGMGVFVLLQMLVLLSYQGRTWESLVFIFLFFTGNGFIPTYLRYQSDLSEFITKPGNHATLEEFCRQYEISPREREVIAEVCNGLSNQQIAEKLFISLQTVKDHTHRIYNKVDVPSRAQLIRMVQEVEIAGKKS